MSFRVCGRKPPLPPCICHNLTRLNCPTDHNLSGGVTKVWFYIRGCGSCTWPDGLWNYQPKVGANAFESHKLIKWTYQTTALLVEIFFSWFGAACELRLASYGRETVTQFARWARSYTSLVSECVFWCNSESPPRRSNLLRWNFLATTRRSHSPGCDRRKKAFTTVTPISFAYCFGSRAGSRPFLCEDRVMFQKFMWYFPEVHVKRVRLQKPPSPQKNRTKG